MINGAAPELTPSSLGLSIGVVVAAAATPFIYAYFRANVTKYRPTEIEEASGASRIEMAIGEFIADLTIIIILICVVTGSALIIFWQWRLGSYVEMFELVAPIWLIGLPSLAITASCCSALSSLRVMRGTIGDIVFAVIWLVSLIVPLAYSTGTQNGGIRPYDVHGFVEPIIRGSLENAEGIKELIIGRSTQSDGVVKIDGWKTFMNEEYILSRAGWILIAFIIVLLGAAGHSYPLQAGNSGRIATAYARLSSSLSGADGPSGAWLPMQQQLPKFARGTLVHLRLLLLPDVLWASAWLVAFVTGSFLSVEGAMQFVSLLAIFRFTTVMVMFEKAGWISFEGSLPGSTFGRRVSLVGAGVITFALVSSIAWTSAIIGGNYEAPVIVASCGIVITGIIAVLSSIARSEAAVRILLLIAWYGWVTG